MPAKYTISDMKRIAEERHGKCLSTEFKTVDTKLIWQCDKEHVWENTPYHIMKGQWCRICKREQAALKRRDTIGHMIEIAQQKGGECLSSEYKGDTGKLLWKCSEGHKWETTPGNIKSGCWCPICSGVPRDKKINLIRMQKLAEKHGGKCISDKYINRNTKLKWQCANGHVWQTEPRFIMQGMWCKECFNDSRRDTIERMKEIALEHGGECLSDEYINQYTRLRWRCADGHEWTAIANNISGGKWCPVCAGNTKLSIQQMHKLASERGGKCLSIEYINSKTSLLWECDKGHQWKATPTNVNRGTWCPECAGIYKGGVSELTDSLRKSIREWKKESMRNYNYRCAITGEKHSDLQIHHSKPFHVLRDEVLKELKLPIHQHIGDYSKNELDLIIERLNERHEEVDGIPLRRYIHELFHAEYGYETILNDFNEFKIRFLSGEFKDNISTI